MTRQYHCFNCGEQVDSEDYDLVGYRRVHVCGRSECIQELSRDINEAYEQDREDALEEIDARYGRW